MDPWEERKTTSPGSSHRAHSRGGCRVRIRGAFFFVFFCFWPRDDACFVAVCLYLFVLYEILFVVFFLNMFFFVLEAKR